MMFGSILVLFVLPWLDTSPVRSARFRPVYRQLFLLLVASVVVLGCVRRAQAAGHLGHLKPPGARCITSCTSW